MSALLAPSNLFIVLDCGSYQGILDCSLFSLGGGGLLLGLGCTSSLLLLDVLRDELLVLGGLLLGSLIAFRLLSLDELLAADTLLSDQTLDLGYFVVGLVTTSDLTLGDIAAHIILLLVQAENGGNLVLSLLEETVRNLLVSAAFNLGVALLDNLEGDDGEVGTSDAAAD